ncbi:hypothetical protein CNEO2_20149 [Clostridium neonatale]|nr:hypothetical protein CNEO2_20149 [Clostridium neonatale]CAI3240192.1 hypothetical protein CNEO2_20162 [Clostridium neonatale]CAI3540543.1 hypothetical protein CNEO4_190007 [Clostridium neonatale]
MVNWIVIENTEEVQRISEKVALKLEKIGPVMSSVGRFINKDVRKMLSAIQRSVKECRRNLQVMWRQVKKDEILYFSMHLI